MPTCTFEYDKETVSYFGEPLDMLTAHAKADNHFQDKFEGGEWVLDEQKYIVYHTWEKKQLDVQSTYNYDCGSVYNCQQI